jgi:hypothetical protein
MADIEIVIKIQEKDYLTFSKLSEKEKINELTYYEKMIAYGKPLPKGHGRLIDADAVLEEPIGNTYKDIDIAETIIEAESED